MSGGMFLWISVGNVSQKQNKNKVHCVSAASIKGSKHLQGKCAHLGAFIQVVRGFCLIEMRTQLAVVGWIIQNTNFTDSGICL